MAKTKEAKLAKKAAAKELKKEKQLLKANKKKCKEAGLDTGEEDLFALLKKYEAKASAQDKAIGQLVNCSQPSPRALGSLTSLPTGELFLFAGEFYDGSKVVVYNEAYRWNIDRNEWRRVECPVSPKPRCSHQAVFFKDSVFCFGGEFSTVDQFYHFRDLWRFHLKTNTWEEVQCTGVGPSARSGHRMVVYKNQLVVFGGFHDTLRETRYFNDIHVLCLQTFKWTRLTVPPHAHGPSPRSGVLMVAYPPGNGIFISGGYCKVKDTNKGAQGKSFADSWWLNMTQINADIASKATPIRVWEKLGRNAALPSPRSGMAIVPHKALAVCFGGVTDEDEGGTTLRSIYYNDLLGFDLERKRWLSLSLKQSKKSGKEKETRGKLKKSLGVKKAQNTAAVAVDASSVPGNSTDHSDSSDEEDEDETTFGYIDQEGKLVRIKLENFREEPTNSEPSVPSPCSEVISKLVDQTPARGCTSAEERAADKNLNEESLDFRSNVEDAPNAISCGSCENKAAVANASPANLQPDFETPLPRFNPMLAMKDHDLVMYGGLMELGHKELTLDDCWSINLNTRAQWKCIVEGHLDEHPWSEPENDPEEVGDDDLDSEDYSENDSDGTTSASESSDSDEDAHHNVAELQNSGKETPDQDQVVRPARSRATLREKMVSVRAKLQALNHGSQLPESQESLRDFFDRTKSYWLENAKVQDDGTTQRCITDKKELRRVGFALASAHFDRVAPFLKKLERYEALQKELELDTRNKKNVSSRST